MSQYTVSGEKGFVNGVSDLADGTLVKLSSGKVVAAAAATDAILGVTVGAHKANSQHTNIRLRSAQGTMKVKLGGTVAVGDALTSNASGVAITTTTAGNQIVGVALEAGVSGDYVEAMCATGKF